MGRGIAYGSRDGAEWGWMVLVHRIVMFLAGGPMEVTLPSNQIRFPSQERFVYWQTTNYKQ